MSTRDPVVVAEILSRIRDGDQGELKTLVSVVYDDLKHLAAKELRRERAGPTPSSLVHETFERLVDKSNVTWEDRAHFFAVAAREMRRVLVDRARREGALKRGGGWQRISIREADAGISDLTIELLSLEEALENLGRLKGRHQQVAECRLYGEMTYKEIGHVLGHSEETIRKDWQFVRTWLQHELGECGHDDI